MTSTTFVNVSSNAASAQSSSIKDDKAKKKDHEVQSGNPKAEPKSFISTVAELDEKIEKLEKESEKTKGGLFSKVYNVFSKKDNKLDKELEELKAAKKMAQADGVVTQQELAMINKEYSETQDSLKTYKDGKKKAADTTSTIAAIGAGVAVGIATGGVGLVAGAAIGAVASGGAKMLTKEVMLGDEYDMLGKEGIKDGLISAAYGATGGLVSAAGKAAAPLLVNGASKAGIALSQGAAKAIGQYGTKLVADEALMVGIKVANGQEVTAGDVFATGVASLTFTKAGNVLGKTNLFKISENTDELAKIAKVSTVASTTFIGKKELKGLID